MKQRHSADITLLAASFLSSCSEYKVSPSSTVYSFADRVTACTELLAYEPERFCDFQYEYLSSSAGFSSDECLAHYTPLRDTILAFASSLEEESVDGRVESFPLLASSDSFEYEGTDNILFFSTSSSLFFCATEYLTCQSDFVHPLLAGISYYPAAADYDGGLSYDISSAPTFLKMEVSSPFCPHFVDYVSLSYNSAPTGLSDTYSDVYSMFTQDHILLEKTVSENIKEIVRSYE